MLVLKKVVMALKKVSLKNENTYIKITFFLQILLSYFLDLFFVVRFCFVFLSFIVLFLHCQYFLSSLLFISNSVGVARARDLHIKERPAASS